MAKKRIAKRKSNKWEFVISLILTALFLLTFILGLAPIYPFGYSEMVGDVITSRLTLLTKMPIYPLIITYDILDKINLPEGKIELVYLIISGIILIFYYYLLSRILIFLYLEFKNRINKK